MNRRTRMTWPDGFYVSYAYDAVSELTGITDSTGTTVTNYAYDNLGRRTGITRGNGVSTAYNYDSFSNLTNLAHGSLQSYSLAYNASGQIKSLTSNNDSFAYPAAAMSRAYGLNGLNQTTASGSLTVSYDGRGNVSSDGVNTYAYDVANRLTGMSSSATLSYDPLSRLSKTVGSATTQFLYDGTDLIAEFDGSGNLLRRYIHGPGSDEPVAWYEGSGTANRQWLLANAQGSVIAVTNASGGVTAINTYDEYGLPGSGNVGRFQYTGQKWIPEIGMYDYKARIYSPGFGRFLQTDPIGYGDGPNWYAYVHGNPISGRDSMGTQDDGQIQITSPDDITVIGQKWHPEAINPSSCAGYDSCMRQGFLPSSQLTYIGWPVRNDVLWYAGIRHVNPISKERYDYILRKHGGAWIGPTSKSAFYAILLALPGNLNNIVEEALQSGWPIDVRESGVWTTIAIAAPIDSMGGIGTDAQGNNTTFVKVVLGATPVPGVYNVINMYPISALPIQK